MDESCRARGTGSYKIYLENLKKTEPNYAHEDVDANGQN
jgi:hypothetical protein